MMKKGLIAILAVVLSVAGIYAQKRFVMLDKVVAVVGNSSIFYSDIEQMSKQLVAQRREQGYTSDRDPMNEALENLLMRKLLYNQALIDSVDINKGDVSQRVNDQLDNMITSAGSLRELETSSHMAVYNIKELLRRSTEEQAYAAAMQHEVVGKVTVIPGEIDRYYRNIDRDSLPTIAEQYVYAQITKFPSGMDDAKRRAKVRLLEMRERIVSGKTKFATLARMYSVDGSAIRGGEMEAMSLASFVKPFADALGDLKEGQISGVVETEFGFHLIQLIDKRGNLYHCRHILLRPTYTDAELSAPLYTLDSLANVIRKDSITFEAAAAKYSDDVYSKQNGGIVSNHDLLEHYDAFDAKLTATRFMKEDFGANGGKRVEDLNALEKLKVGEISPAYQSSDLLGNSISKIVKLVEIIPAHPASLKEDYLRLEQMALAAKQEKVFKEWLNKKIAGMYVYIAPEYRNGDFENKKWVKRD